MLAEMVELGRKVVDIRRSRVLSQRALASRAGLSVVTVRGVETGQVETPHAETVHKLATALEVDPRDLADVGLSAAQVLRRADRLPNQPEE